MDLTIHSFALLKEELQLSKTEDTVLKLADKLADELGFFVVDVELKNEGGEKILRVYIDKDGGVDLDDCETFSRAFDAIIDEADPIAEAYNLEVSSPGLDRRLKKEREFLHYIGRRVEVKLFKEINGIKEFDGILTDYSEKTAYIDNNGETIMVNPKDAAYIKLYFEF